MVGLDPHPADPERFSAADGFEVHICPVIGYDPAIHTNNWMPNGLPALADSMARRVTRLSFRVDSLADIVSRVFAYGGIQPFSLDDNWNYHVIPSVAHPLQFGTRSVHVADPDNNLFEFVESGVSTKLASLI